MAQQLQEGVASMKEAGYHANRKVAQCGCRRSNIHVARMVQIGKTCWDGGKKLFLPRERQPTRSALRLRLRSPRYLALTALIASDPREIGRLGASQPPGPPCR